MKNLLCLLALFAALPLLGQAMPPAGANSQRPSGQDQQMPTPNTQRTGQMPSTPDTAAPPVNANEARENIQDKLNAVSELKDRVMAQVVDDHTIALTGTVKTKAEHDQALDIAEKNSGDRTLVDHIQVGETSNSQSTTAPQNNSNPSTPPQH